MKTLLVSVLSFALTGLVFAYEPRKPPRDDVVVGVGMSDEYHPGLPMFAVVTFTNVSEHTVSFPVWDARRSALPFTIHAKSDNGTEYESSRSLLCSAFSMPTYVENLNQPTRDIEFEKWNLAASQFKVRDTDSYRPIGESRRNATNFGPMLKTMRLPPGKYEITIRVWKDTNSVVGETKPISLKVAPLPANEMEELLKKTAIPKVIDASFAEGIELEDILPIVGEKPGRQLAFAFLLRDVLRAKELSDISIDKYRDHVPSWLKPELQLFEYEVLLARRELRKAAKIKASLLRDHHALRPHIDAADKAKGYLRTMRIPWIEKVRKLMK